MSQTIAQYQQNKLAAIAALHHYQSLQVAATKTVAYQSRGRLLIIGPSEALTFVDSLSDNLNISFISLNTLKNKSSRTEKRLEKKKRKIELQGYLGNFSLKLGEEGDGLGTLEVLTADVILDLSPKPLIELAMPPNGYLHHDLKSGEDIAMSLAPLKPQLENLVGRFEKPVFVQYDPSSCAHKRHNMEACRKCIDACPAEALSSLDELIQVNTYLCQGGGICASVCPSGAIQYNYPNVRDQLGNLRQLLKVYAENGGIAPHLFFYAQADGDAPQLSETRLTHLAAQGSIFFIAVEELASLSMETWLSLLAYGVASIHFIHRPNTLASLLEEMEKQVALCQEILATLKLSPKLIQLIGESQLNDDSELQLASMPSIAIASYAAMGDKRQILFFALDHLYQQAQILAQQNNTQIDALVHFSSQNAPQAIWGEVQVETNCTLCMSCVSACPSSALQTGDGLPQLRFVEANCLQCGLCAQVCPENVISLNPRLNFERSQRQSTQILHEEEPFLCVSCGKPFASRSVIEAMLTKLGGHWMFKTERAKERLKMCEDCRVIDVVQDEAALNSFENSTEGSVQQNAPGQRPHSGIH